MTPQQKEDAVFSSIKDADEAESYLGASWDELPDVVTAAIERSGSNPAAKVKAKVQSFINGGETWTDSDYMEMTDNNLFNKVKTLNKYTQKAYNLIRSYEQNKGQIMPVKQELKKLLLYIQ